jgi:hypothetical protein
VFRNGGLGRDPRSPVLSRSSNHDLGGANGHGLNSLDLFPGRRTFRQIDLSEFRIRQDAAEEVIKIWATLRVSTCRLSSFCLSKASSWACRKSVMSKHEPM